MSINEMKSIYSALLSSGDLFDMFPDMVGDWERDSKFFKDQYNESMKIVNSDTDEDFLFEDYEEYE